MQPMAVHDTPVLVIDKVRKVYRVRRQNKSFSDVVKNIGKQSHKENLALDNISLTVNKGEFVAYAGANGAGKSTTIKILSGIIQPTSGEVSVLGINPTKGRIDLMKRIGVLFGQRSELWWDLSIMTSFLWKKQVWNIPDKVFSENVKVLSQLLELGDIENTYAKELSLGQRMRADLAMMLLHSPELIFLDEPTLGLDVLAKRNMIEFLKEINRKNGVTIVVTSHDMDDLEEMANRIVLLSKGKVIYDGPFEKLRERRGSISHIHITKKGTAPKIEGLLYVASSHNVHEYKVVDSHSQLNEILKAISGIDGILDIEIKKDSLEELIAGIYLWENNINKTSGKALVN